MVEAETSGFSQGASTNDGYVRNSYTKNLFPFYAPEQLSKKGTDLFYYYLK